MLSWLRLRILRVLKPFLAWSSGVHAPWTHKRINGLVFQKIAPQLKPGSVFVTKIRGDLTSFIIPGFWSHAAIFTPTKAQYGEFVTEAEGPGVIKTDLITFLTSKDEVMVLEPYVPDYVKARAAEIAETQLGKPYDYDLDFSMSDEKAFYCSELVWWSYAQACKEFNVPCPFIPQIELGVETISPDNIANSANFHVVFDSRKQVSR